MLKRFFIEDRSPLCLDPLAEIVGSWEVGCTPEDDHHLKHLRHKPVIFLPSPLGLWSLQIEMESKKDLRAISHTGTLVLDCVVQTERVKSTRTAVLPCHLIIDIFDKIIFGLDFQGGTILTTSKSNWSILLADFCYHCVQNTFMLILEPPNPSSHWTIGIVKKMVAW